MQHLSSFLQSISVAVTRQLRGKWPELYSLRAVGVALIFLYHAWGISGAPLLKASWGGVSVTISALFAAASLGTSIVFVLAGFLNQLNFERAAQAGRPFPDAFSQLKRRLLRIAPLYYVCIITGILISGSLLWLAKPINLAEIFSSFIFLHPFLSPTRTSIMGMNWAVEAVVEFYLLLPILARLMAGRRWRVSLPVLLLLVVLFRAISGQSATDAQWWEHSLPGRLDHFLFGMMTAKFVAWAERPDAPKELVQRMARWFGVAAAIIGLLAFTLMVKNPFVPGTVWWLFLRMTFAAAIACAIPYLLLAPRGIIHRLAAQPVLVLLGLIGYSAFLWHMMLFISFSMFGIFGEFNSPERLTFYLLAGVPLTIVISAVSFVTLELPFMSRRKPSAGAEQAVKTAITITERM